VTVKVFDGPAERSLRPTPRLPVESLPVVANRRTRAYSGMDTPSGRVAALILPGLSNSGPTHWQTLWEQSDPSCRRVEQAEWETPRCADWVSTLDAAVAASADPVVLVAHSSSCALVAHWARDASAEFVAKARGALLVAPSDPEGPNYPEGPTGFAPMPTARLPFPSIVVASRDDLYVTFERAREYASAWGSELVDLGDAGHINASSGLGTWSVGYGLLQRLRTQTANAVDG